MKVDNYGLATERGWIEPAGLGTETSRIASALPAATNRGGDAPQPYAGASAGSGTETSRIATDGLGTETSRIASAGASATNRGGDAPQPHAGASAGSGTETSRPSQFFFTPHAPIERHGKHLPHWQQQECLCFITWRLADSIPMETLRDITERRERWIKIHPHPWTQETEAEYNQTFMNEFEVLLDQGNGSRFLRTDAASSAVLKTMTRMDGDHYRLFSVVVMPTHIHTLVQPLPGHELSKIIGAWKSVSARQMASFGAPNPVWAKTYWDRLIRNIDHFRRAETYIAKNPAKAHLDQDEYRLVVFRTLVAVGNNNFEVVHPLG